MTEKRIKMSWKTTWKNWRKKVVNKIYMNATRMTTNALNTWCWAHLCHVFLCLCHKCMKYADSSTERGLNCCCCCLRHRVRGRMSNIFVLVANEEDSLLIGQLAAWIELLTIKLKAKLLRRPALRMPLFHASTLSSAPPLSHRAHFYFYLYFYRETAVNGVCQVQRPHKSMA